MNSIITQTRKGNCIDNFQDPAISQTNQNYFRPISLKYAHLKPRSLPTGLYNCHGLTFASRRCFIEKPSEVKRILLEDDFDEIRYLDALPGDIAVYYSSGDLEHSGIVIESAKGLIKIPTILSKWSCMGEYIHKATDCPYDATDIHYYRIYK